MRMKTWEKAGIPTMHRAELLIYTRNKIWAELRDDPNLDAVYVARGMKYIEQLNKQIARRTLTPKQLEDLLKEVKRYSRNYSRVAKKFKKTFKTISARQIKTALKNARNHGNK